MQPILLELFSYVNRLQLLVKVMGHYRYKLTVGEQLEHAYADTKEHANTLAEKLALKYRSETIVVLDTEDGATAFTVSAIYCPTCD